MATATKFVRLEAERDYKGASELLSDSFMFVSVAFIARTRQEWLENFPKIHCSCDPFEPQLLKGKHCNQVIRIGSLRTFGLPTCKIRKIMEFDKEGKIESMTVERIRDERDTGDVIVLTRACQAILLCGRRRLK